MLKRKRAVVVLRKASFTVRTDGQGVTGWLGVEVIEGRAERLGSEMLTELRIRKAGEEEFRKAEASEPVLKAEIREAIGRHTVAAAAEREALMREAAAKSEEPTLAFAYLVSSHRGGPEEAVAVRQIVIPAGETSAHPATMELLGLAFTWGQNDFAPLRCCSVSCGDILHVHGPEGPRFARVMGCGFEFMEKLDLSALGLDAYDLSFHRAPVKEGSSSAES